MKKNNKKENVHYTWTNELGDMNKYFNGENPLPKKDVKANANSWKCKSFSI